VDAENHPQSTYREQAFAKEEINLSRTEAIKSRFSKRVEKEVDE